MSENTGKRLNKFISESGYCSRRAADKLIENSRVTINGKVPELGTKVLPGDKVFVDGKFVAASPENKSDRIYIAYHKPIGITCTTERHVRGNIIDAIGHKERIFPIGRLDKPSEGLIFLTSDGDIVNKILRAENAHDKEYIVTVDKPISERFLDRMARGVPILGTITKPCVVKMQSKFVFRIILTQGLNRQIRRMCEYLGYDVKKLKRSRIMNVELAGLKPGQWRDLTKTEMAEINAAVATSSKTAEGDNFQEPAPALKDKQAPAPEKKIIQTSDKISIKTPENPKRKKVRKPFKPFNPNQSHEKAADKKPNPSTAKKEKRIGGKLSLGKK
ncbi:23S rRNA pseudouridine(2604) synthase RluF [Thalassotalea sp. PLHSN55]|uniref:23S rRNA pseudouridine(2604) synthase RluF n=1 Tax=Thalassotalea sp. PLHSN55 TaxID=3435888 RepID=UPI003F876246